MKRRDFIKKAGITSAVATTVAAPNLVRANSKKTHEWKMVTAFPKNFPGVGRNAEVIAEKIYLLTGGQVRVKVFGAGELVPAFEVFDAVSQGTAQVGHAAAYYWKSKNPAFQFFTAIPFGMTPQEMTGWMYQGEGLELWKEGYAKFNLTPFPALNTDAQMGGWFNKEINTVEDIKGLKIRLPGLGGEVFKKLGATPVTIPGGEIYTSMQSGVLDAVDWVGPFNDLAFGLQKVAKYYYYPSFAEPQAILEGMFNKEALEALPEDVQTKIIDATRVAYLDGWVDMSFENAVAIQKIVESGETQLKPFPKEVLEALKKTSKEVVEELANTDEYSKRVYESYSKYRERSMAWTEISQKAFLNSRS